MRRPITGALALTTFAAAALYAAGPAATPEADVPADAATAGGLLDDFVNGRSAALTDRASPQLKAALAKMSLDDVRAKTVGQIVAPAVGPDTIAVTRTRRLAGEDGKAYDVIATVSKGQLTGFFVRLAP